MWPLPASFVTLTPPASLQGSKAQIEEGVYHILVLHLYQRPLGITGIEAREPHIGKQIHLFIWLHRVSVSAHGVFYLLCSV